MGQLIAGPFAGCLLGYFGAEVIKIESPVNGDPLRQWRVVKDGTSLWWRSLARNKKSVTINLKTRQGRNIAKQLIEKSDVVIENFRPGTMEKWGLGPEEFKQTHDQLIYARISGYGQTGPYANRPGFASVCEGIGGLRYVNGFPGEAPVRPNLSLGDSLAGLHAAFGICLALLQRNKPDSEGQVVDVALFESVFNLLEAVVPEFDGAGIIREPSGSTLTGIAPTNTYRCEDGKFVIIGGNGDSIFQRLMLAIGRDDLAQTERLTTNLGRVANEEELDEAISDWTRTRPSDKVLRILTKADVPCGPIYSVADILNDKHFNARDLFESVTINGAPLKIPAITPKLDGTPGRTEWPGGEIGAHTEDVLSNILGLNCQTIRTFRQKGFI